MLNAGDKICSRILNQRLQVISDIILIKEHSGFWKRSSSIYDIFLMKQIIVKPHEFNLKTRIVIVDYEKAFEKIDRRLL